MNLTVYFRNVVLTSSSLSLSLSLSLSGHNIHLHVSFAFPEVTCISRSRGGKAQPEGCLVGNANGYFPWSYQGETNWFATILIHCFTTHLTAYDRRNLEDEQNNEVKLNESGREKWIRLLGAWVVLMEVLSTGEACKFWPTPGSKGLILLYFSFFYFFIFFPVKHIIVGLLLKNMHSSGTLHSFTPYIKRE